MPILWSPISERIGRRPVYLISALVSAVCVLGGAYCKSYGTLMTTRVFHATFMAPAQSLGACTVSEMFFVHEKGRKMGIWGERLRSVRDVTLPLTTAVHSASSRLRPGIGASLVCSSVLVCSTE